MLDRLVLVLSTKAETGERLRGGRDERGTRVCVEELTRDEVDGRVCDTEVICASIVSSVRIIADGISLTLVGAALTLLLGLGIALTETWLLKADVATTVLAVGRGARERVTEVL